jgi:predicted YcjX-like family ATPase
MQTNILRHPKVINLKSKLSNQAIRLLDSHVSLAVTGLSGSGKTAFITSLVNQLLEIKSNDSLPFFAVANQGRVIGVKRDIQPDVRCNRFAYEEAMQGLSTEQPRWPQSTRGISQVRLLIKYQKNTGLTQFLSETRVLTLDITDYNPDASNSLLIPNHFMVLSSPKVGAEICITHTGYLPVPRSNKSRPALRFLLNLMHT